MWTGRKGCCRGDDADKPDAGEVSRYNIRRGIEGSLERLQVDCIDLYQLHWPARYVPLFGMKQYRPEHCRDAAGFEEMVGVRQLPWDSHARAGASVLASCLLACRPAASQHNPTVVELLLVCCHNPDSTTEP